MEFKMTKGRCESMEEPDKRDRRIRNSLGIPADLGRPAFALCAVGAGFLHYFLSSFWSPGPPCRAAEIKYRNI
jgi:hypothetical protein